MPGEQLWQDESPNAENVDGRQSVHSVAATLEDFPPGQWVQFADPAILVNLPCEQLTQTELDIPPKANDAFPAGHLVGVAAPAPQYVPRPHTPQTVAEEAPI